MASLMNHFSFRLLKQSLLCVLSTGWGSAGFFCAFSKHLNTFALFPRYGVGCAYIHGQQCDYCGQAVNSHHFSETFTHTLSQVLHPTHLDQRRGHLAECLQEHERDMELSFAVARSKEKTCGICMETVLDKPKGEARWSIVVVMLNLTFLILFCPDLEFFPTAPIASVCHVSESGDRQSSLSTRSSERARSAGRPQTTFAQAGSGWKPQRRKEDCSQITRLVLVCSNWSTVPE